MADSRSRRSGSPTGSRRYPRTARINQVLREVIAEELEKMVSRDDRLSLLTVTGVDIDADLRHAKVWLGSLSDDAAEALAEQRTRLQAAIAAQVRMRRTPLLSFAADPAIASSGRIDEIIRNFPPAAPGSAGDGGAGGEPE